MCVEEERRDNGKRLRALVSGGSADNCRITSGASEGSSDLIIFYVMMLCSTGYSLILRSRADICAYYEECTLDTSNARDDRQGLAVESVQSTM